MRHLTWLEYQTTYLAPGVPCAYRILGDPAALVVLTERSHQLRISVETTLTLPALPEALTASVARDGEGIWTVVELTDPSLLREFYSWATLVCDLVQVDRMAVPAALVEATRRWELLLRPEVVPTHEALVGLAGELLTLHALARHNPAKALKAWVGPERAPFDFVLGDAAIEVKTTVRAGRIHTFHGIEQLHAPVVGASYILSWHLQEGGSNSLPLLVATLRGLFADWPGLAAVFASKLVSTGAVTAEGTVADLRFEVRNSASLLQLGVDLFPAGGAWFVESLGPRLAGRLRDVSVQLDCSGLGTTLDLQSVRTLLSKGAE